MDIFLTVAGLIIGISAFLYLVNAMDAGKRKYRTASRSSSGTANTASTAGTVMQKGSVAALNAGNRSIPSGTSDTAPQPIRMMPEEVKEMMKQRTCPMCAHSLLRDEPLYASHIEIGKEKKVLIYGCPYCYKGERK